MVDSSDHKKEPDRARPLRNLLKDKTLSSLGDKTEIVDGREIIRIGRYEILELVGRGGMGVVFKARDPELDRVVALKILSEQLAGDSGFVDRFTREAKALARLQHPNIVTVHDYGRQDDNYFFVMEYIDGVSLGVVNRKKRCPPKRLSPLCHCCATPSNTLIPKAWCIGTLSRTIFSSIGTGCRK